MSITKNTTARYIKLREKEEELEKKKCTHTLGITKYKDEFMEYVEPGYTLERTLKHLESCEVGYNVDWYAYCPRCGVLLPKQDI